jgi:hypothetical protein
MAQTAPPGYQSNLSAILDLIRYGYGIWTPSQMAALLFHAERSTAMGRNADQHSAGQSTKGIYSTRSLSWVRGPSGLSPATWYRANNELAIDAEKPETEKTGVLRRIARTNRFGKSDPTEFQLDWTAIKRRIGEWKERQNNQELSEGESLNLRDSKGEETEKGVPQIETLSLSERETHPLKLRDSTQDAAATGPGPRGVSLNLRDTVKSKSLSTKVGQSQRAREDPTAAAIAAAIEEATGERPTDILTNSILQTGQRLRLPLRVTVRWIHEKCQEVRARGYPLRAGLLAGAAETELIGWCKSNIRFLQIVQMEIEREEHRQEQEKHQRMPAAEPAADPDFAANLLREIATRKAAG